MMEPKIREYLNIAYDTNFVEGKHEDETLGFRCHTDGENEYQVLEIKTTSQIRNNIEDYKIYLVQLLFYMMNTKKEEGILAIYERPKDLDEEFDANRLTIYKIKLNDYDYLCDEIYEAVEHFKEDLKKLKENPLLSEEDLLPTSIQEISNKIIAIENQLATYKQLEQQQKELKEQLYNAMIENNVKKWETPNGTKITLVEGTEDSMQMVFNEDKFKEEQPDAYNNYLEEKIKKGRSGYIKITLGKE